MFRSGTLKESRSRNKSGTKDKKSLYILFVKRPLCAFVPPEQRQF